MPMAWYPYAQVPAIPPMTVEMHTYGDPLDMLPTVRRVVAQIDPNLPLEDPQTQQALFDSSYFFNTLTGWADDILRTVGGAAGGDWIVRHAGLSSWPPHAGDRRADGVGRDARERAVDGCAWSDCGAAAVVGRGQADAVATVQADMA